MQKIAELVDWENNLQEMIAYVELLGELDLTEDDVKRIGVLIARLVRSSSQATALQVLKTACSTTLAAYLVAKGVYGYREGNYWESIAEEIGWNTGTIQQLGLLFEDFLRDHALPTFPGGSQHGLRYVSVVLLHGGIPNYCLNDFFEKFLQPVLSDSDYSGLSERDIVTTWLHSPAKNAVDKPVPRFLEYGGKIALDFVARCLEMGRYFNDQPLASTSETLGLPKRVIEAYRAWARGRTQARLAEKVHLARPEIILDPWGSGLLAELPAQTLPSSFDEHEGNWMIQADQHRVEIPLRLRWHGKGMNTDLCQVELSHPAKAYTITFAGGPSRKRTWQFRGMTPELPLMAFEPDSGELVQFLDTLPARRLWLLYPLKQQPRIEGGQKCEEFPGFSGAWAGYTADEWDLSQASSVTIGKTTLPVEVDAASLLPYLVGNEVQGLLRTVGQPVLFAGPPPTIYIPLTPQRKAELEAVRWHIVIRDNEKHVVCSKSIVDIPYLVEKDALKVFLSDSSLLDRSVFGSFEISLRGPLGRDTTFSISIVPALDIRMRDRDVIRFPDTTGIYTSPQITIITSPDVTLESNDPEIQIRFQQQGHYLVTVPAEYVQAECTLRSLTSAAPRPISCTIALPVLHWAIIEG
ncbi:MAG TPA: hypothetical protein VNE38_11080, partial [Ktedonobacteraceae bacterium]|nr:hypothetical protein [Ktedonobacteraceae bacterium]